MALLRETRHRASAEKILEMLNSELYKLVVGYVEIRFEAKKNQTIADKKNVIFLIFF